ncbi:hypothetical protein HQ520_15160 [bacterium]|nr:hypothetical protein [bacterium]
MDRLASLRIGALAALLLIAAASQAQPLVEGIQPDQVFAVQEHRATIPFRALQSGSLAAEVRDCQTGEVMAQARWEIIPGAPPVSDPPEDSSKPLRTSARDLYIPRVPINPSAPYQIRFQQGAVTQQIDNILVGEIWAVAGCANAYGAPGRKNRLPIPQVHYLKNDVWQAGEDPLIDTPETLAAGYQWVTPWLRAAQDYYKNTGIPVGVTGWAYPGLSISSLWSEDRQLIPVLRDFLEKDARNASTFFWFQGAADAYPAAIDTYPRYLQSLADSARRLTANPDLLMVVFQLPHYQLPTGAQPTPYFGRVRDAQFRFALRDSKTLLIPTMQFDIRASYLLAESGIHALAIELGQVLSRTRERGVSWYGPKPAVAGFDDASHRRIIVRFDEVERLVLDENAESDWMISDDRHLGYPEAQVLGVKDGVLNMRLEGARTGQLVSPHRDPNVRLQLEDSGFLRVMRASVHGKNAVRLDLAEPALPGATVSYGLWNNSSGSLRDGSGQYCPAFKEISIQPSLPR